MAYAPEAYLFSHAARTIFDYLGVDEDARTYAIGVVLARVEAFAETFLEAAGVAHPARDLLRVSLQRTGGDGRTDLELIGSDFHVIVEAKRGWEIPLAQLGQYCGRFQLPSQACRLVALTACSNEFARRRLAPQNGIAVSHVRWDDVVKAIQDARKRTRGTRDLYLLGELSTYLKGVIAMQDQTSNLVYILSLGRATVRGRAYLERHRLRSPPVLLPVRRLCETRGLAARPT